MQEARLYNSLGSVSSSVDNPFDEEIFPKSPLTQLEIISAHPVILYLGEKTPTSLQPPFR